MTKGGPIQSTPNDNPPRFDAGQRVRMVADLSVPPSASSRPSPGVISASVGFFLWGLFPLYWKQIQSVPAFELIAHRIVWSLLVLLGVIAWRNNFSTLRPAFLSGRSFGINVLSSLLLAVNWTVYVWGVNAGYIIETSLGYFLVPLVNVALGSFLLHEKMRRLQWIAVGLATGGVALLLVRVGHFPWIALTIACTWSGYGLLKKKSVLGPIAGLTVETLLLFPVAAGLLLWWNHQGSGALGQSDLRTHAFVIGTGLITTTPLLLFAYGAQRIRLTTLGLLQYIAPSVQFLIGLLIYHETFDTARFQAFGFIWAGLILYTTDGYLAQRLVRSSSVSL